jgi:UDP-N-acetylmuramoyl-L-alanyl-D-glutamate--2,6-diaminopimelate ligase
LAGSYADYVVVTDEDPYDENPRSIMEAVADGVKAAGKKAGENYWIVEDRRAAIRQALALAKENDTVVITGKGAEQWLCAAGGKKIPWDDRVIVKAELDVIRHK